jgi:hypothetical protein
MAHPFSSPTTYTKLNVTDSTSRFALIKMRQTLPIPRNAAIYKAPFKQLTRSEWTRNCHNFT